MENPDFDFDQFMIHQLNNKFINQPVMVDRLITADINNYNPQDFFSEKAIASGIKECYILTPGRVLYGPVSQPKRRSGNGFWQVFGCRMICGMSGLIGVKQKLYFYEGDTNNRRKTKWRMIEYKLQQHVCSIACDHNSGKLDGWVLCKLYEDLGPEALSSAMERMDISDKNMDI